MYNSLQDLTAGLKGASSNATSTWMDFSVIPPYYLFRRLRDQLRFKRWGGLSGRLKEDRFYIRGFEWAKVQEWNFYSKWKYRDYKEFWDCYEGCCCQRTTELWLINVSLLIERIKRNLEMKTCIYIYIYVWQNIDAYL